MKLNKRFIAVLAAAVLMLVCAMPVFAEAVSETDVLLIAPAPTSDTDVVIEDAEIVMAVESLGADAPADVSTSFMVMGYGMLGIFVVMIIIMVVILLLNVVTKPRKK